MSETETRLGIVCLNFQTGDAIPATAGLRPLKFDDWHSLEEADRVAVQRTGEPLETGNVEGKNVSHDVFWVWLDHGKGRILLHRDDGPQVWRLIER